MSSHSRPGRSGHALISASDLLRPNLLLRRQWSLQWQEQVLCPPCRTHVSAAHLAPCCRLYSECAHMLRVLLLQE
jgi:hypothetical protein